MSNYGRFIVKPAVCTVLTVAYMHHIGVEVAISVGTLSFFALLSLGIEYFAYKVDERRMRKCKSKKK